ncbi:acyl carrier protein [Streptomyces sp. NRRL S-37]|uniref:acyl carrier protein n=1 Tax=Streptomyces sp. NRRL S-37 TaxID=1463903 RepID=UPI0004CC439A
MSADRLLEANLEQDLGMDSMKIIELLEEVEEHFGFSIADEDLAHLRTVRDLWSAIDKSAATSQA